MLTDYSKRIVTDLIGKSHISIGKLYFIGDTNSNRRPCKYSYDLSVARPHKSTVCLTFITLNVIAARHIVTVSHTFSVGKRLGRCYAFGWEDVNNLPFVYRLQYRNGYRPNNKEPCINRKTLLHR
jgi:hypothetical protein